MSSRVPGRLLAVALVSLLASACATKAGATKAGAKVGRLDEQHREPDLVLVTHRVEKGDTLYRISRAYGVGVEDLMVANDIEDPRELKIGEALVVPGAKEPQRAESRDSPEPTPTRTLTEEEAQQRLPKSVKVGRKDGVLRWPVRGVLYARFGKKGREPHDGIDLAAPAGTPVKTAAPGTVLFAGDQKGYGLIVIVEHDQGLITLYAHNRDLRVKTGQKVREGQVVATVGDSGRTSGPHLHFEVRKDGVPVDPLELLGPVPPAS